MGDLSKNFSAWEFECPCCGKSEMNQGTIGRLQRVRTRFGKPINMVVGGGYRCSNYDKSKAGAHKLGQAIDPDIQRDDLWIVNKLAIDEGFTGIGVKNKGGRYQLHLDDAAHIHGVRPRPWIWTY